MLGNYVDTIRVKPGTYDFADASVSNANKAFIMIGTASNVSQTIFDAGGKNNFFYMSSNADTVTVFDGITFKNGKSTQSGGAFTFYSYSRVDFRYSTFEKNKAAYSGGAVLVGGDAVVNFESCIFKDNEAEYEGGAISFQNPYNNDKVRNGYAVVSN